MKPWTKSKRGGDVNQPVEGLTGALPPPRPIIKRAVRSIAIATPPRTTPPPLRPLRT